MSEFNDMQQEKAIVEILDALSVDELVDAYNYYLDAKDADYGYLRPMSDFEDLAETEELLPDESRGRFDIGDPYFIFELGILRSFSPKEICSFICKNEIAHYINSTGDTLGLGDIFSVIMPAKDLPVYYHNFSFARDHNEAELCQRSKKLNSECVEAIEQAITSHRGDDGFHYDMSAAVKEVTDTYGAERVSVVLASQIRNADWDGRYTRSVKNWADGIYMPAVSIPAITSHPVLVNAFAERLQKLQIEREQEKPSVLKSLHEKQAGIARQGKDSPAKDVQKKDNPAL